MRYVVTLGMILALMFAGTGHALEKRNRIQFGTTKTGSNLEIFMEFNQGYAKEKPKSWFEYIQSEKKERIWAPAPGKEIRSQRVLSKLSVITVKAQKAECGKISRLLFLAEPPGTTGKPSASLYAYEYIICDSTGLISSGTMLDQYISKYGMYDTKDYDLGLIVYDGIQTRFRVGVMPSNVDKEKGGLAITIVDNEVFTENYFRWRVALKSSYESVKKLF